jgi:oligopeptide transport system substrate-binding protein
LAGAGPASGPTAAAQPVLRYLSGPPGTLDPAFIADASDVEFLLQVYAGLTRLDEVGDPYPSLASSWETSQDGRVYTFHLRQGLHFSDGSPLDASDVRRSWLRLLDPGVASTAPDVLNVVVGAAERLAGGPEEGVGVEAPDAGTLIVHLRHAAAYFPAITATPATFVVPRTAGKDDSWQSASSFVGSGPYVVDRLAGTDVVLRANSEYVSGAPPIAEVRFIGQVASDSVTAFAAGEIDLAPVASFDATWVAYDPDLGKRLHRAAPLSVLYFGFDTTRPPFDDARVRRAFLLALDRGRLVERAESAAAQPASSLLPPALWPEGMTDERAPDLATARRLLDEAGYADRAKLGTIVINNSGGLNLAPAVAVWRSTLGVDVAVEDRGFGDYLDPKAVRPPHIFTINWIADYHSPDAIYSLLLLPSAASNYGKWSDDDFVNLLEHAAAASTPAEQAAAYRRVEARVDDQVPVIPWLYPDSWWLARDGLRGLGDLTTGLLDFGRVSWAE